MTQKFTDIKISEFLLFLIKLLYYIYTKKNKYDNITLTKKIYYLLGDFCFWLIEFFVKFDMVFDVQVTKSINIVSIFEKIVEKNDISKLSSFKQTLEYNHLRFKPVETVIFIINNKKIIISVDELYNQIQTLLSVIIRFQSFDMLIQELLSEDDFYIELYFSKSIKVD